MPRLENPLQIQLTERQSLGLYRTRTIIDSPQGVRITAGGQELLSFCSNDYLGLAAHPAIAEAFKRGVDRYGVGSGASHLVSGHSRAHHALEEELADFVGSERTLLFSTGYMANIGVVTALVSRAGTILEDRLNHASLIDAARLSRASVRRYRHCDAAHVERLMSGDRPVDLITTDAVFSMEGDLAPLPPLLELARARGAWLLADDAHGLGVLGANGRGSFEHWSLSVRSPAILMGTLGKAIGTFGAFVAGDAAVIETLIQRARTYTYTTALPPAVAEATRESLKRVVQESWRRERLKSLVGRFRAGAAQLSLAVTPSDTPIQSVILGSAAQANRAAQYLRDRRILVPAIRPPTVPEGSARLRVSLSAAHETDDVDRLLEALARLPMDHDAAP